MAGAKQILNEIHQPRGHFLPGGARLALGVLLVLMLLSASVAAVSYIANGGPPILDSDFKKDAGATAKLEDQRLVFVIDHEYSWTGGTGQSAKIDVTHRASDLSYRDTGGPYVADEGLSLRVDSTRHCTSSCHGGFPQTWYVVFPDDKQTSVESGDVALKSGKTAVIRTTVDVAQHGYGTYRVIGDVIEAEMRWAFTPSLATWKYGHIAYDENFEVKSGSWWQDHF